MSKKRTVQTTRRRKTTSDGDRKRASAPSRKKSSGSSSYKPSAGSSGGGSPRPPSSSSGGGGLPFPTGGGGGKPSMLVIGVMVLIGICFFGYMLISGGGDGDDGGQVSQPVVEDSGSTAVNPPATVDTASFSTESEPFTPPPASTEGQTWLIMLYQDADDKILEKDIYLDLNEAEKIGSNDRVHIVAQVDRFDAGYRGDGDWASTKRFYITQDDSLQQLQSRQIEDLGEVNMSDGDSLVDFVKWATETFPADKHVLIMSDHGMGWPGGWSDPAPAGRRDNSTPLSSALGDQLYLNELDDALSRIRAETEIDQFELIGMDACLMAHIEVFSALAPHARYAVASQETEPALGWAYTGFLGELTQNPDMTGADLGRAIVDTYIDEDQRIVDEVERADMLGRGSPLGGLFGSLLGGGGGTTMSAAQLARQMGESVTITAVDLTAMPQLMSDFNDLAVAMQGIDQRAVAQARTYAQSFTSVFGSEIPPSYIDLGHFAQLIKREGGDGMTPAVDSVIASLNDVVIAEKHGPKKSGATGISIYFPNSQLYRTPTTGMQSYTAVAERFAQESLWDDYLAYHYTGRRVDPSTSTVVVPEPNTAVSAPGAGTIAVSPLSLSDDTVAPGQTVALSADIGGAESVGYVYLFVGFVDQAANSVFLADADYLDSADIREMDGIYYPDWGEGEFTVAFEWEPIVFAIDDGQNQVVARFTPQTYGASIEEAVYTVDGTYTYADGGESRHARLYFQNGRLHQVFGFTGAGGSGAPHEIHPQTGDQFTVQEQWMDLDGNGRVAQTTTQDGGTLTFGDDTFYWLDLDAAPGQYIVGFIVEDLDGNKTETFKPITVE